ncbi:MAG: penicillin-binding protein 2 [Hyphomicrobiales bacterium]|nr:penicillin-binding protein 2 [Hyphomicrobiales bacterium]
MKDSRELMKIQKRRFTRRALMIGTGQLGLFGLLGWRLHSLQVVEASKFALLAEENRINLQLLAPERGLIVDRFGKTVADNTNSYRVLLVPDLSNDVAASLDRLERIITVSEEARARVLRQARRQSPYIPIVVANSLTWREFAQINILAPGLPGIQTDILPVRRYRNGYAMAHIVGYVGAANKHEVNDDPVVRLPGFRIGKSGVERGFERALRGVAGNVKLEVDARGRAIRKLEQIGAHKGRELVLTIDEHIQAKAMERIAEERRAAIVALDARTGEIIAMASTPSYDLNSIVKGLTANYWNDLASAPDDPMTNKAVRGQYPPGSTFKMVTALAGLEAGVITEKTKFHCYGGYSYHRAHFGCWKRGGHRAVRLHKAIKQSCDVYFYTVAEKIGIKKLSAMGRKLGLGQTYDFGFPQQKAGVMPTPGWKRATLGLPWYGGETIIAGIGQGFVLTTPLQLAVMTARIATGRQVVPRIVRPDPDEPAKLPEKLGIPEDHLQAVRTGMWAVVNEGGGTAGRARLGIAGVEMAGKTGTSQVNSASSGRKSSQLKWEQRDHGLFVAFAPADNPRYAVAVVVEHGGSGSRAASPVARDIMIELVNRDPLAKPAYVASDAPRKTAGEKPKSGEG